MRTAPLLLLLVLPAGCSPPGDDPFGTNQMNTMIADQQARDAAIRNTGQPAAPVASAPVAPPPAAGAAVSPDEPNLLPGAWKVMFGVGRVDMANAPPQVEQNLERQHQQVQQNGPAVKVATICLRPAERANAAGNFLLGTHDAVCHYQSFDRSVDRINAELVCTQGSTTGPSRASLSGTMRPDYYDLDMILTVPSGHGTDMTNRAATRGNRLGDCPN